MALGIGRKLYLDRSEEIMVEKGEDLHSNAGHCLIRGPVASMRGFSPCRSIIFRTLRQKLLYFLVSADWGKGKDFQAPFSESSCYNLFSI